MRRSFRRQQRNHYEPFVSGNLPWKQGLRLGDHSSTSIPYHVEFHPFRSGGHQSATTRMRVRFRGGEQQTRGRHLEETRDLLRLEITTVNHIRRKLYESDFHVRQQVTFDETSCYWFLNISENRTVHLSMDIDAYLCVSFLSLNICEEN